MGAWIETRPCFRLRTSLLSHPTWVRGLKRFINMNVFDILKSHPTWVRGLKLNLRTCFSLQIRVAPYVGAWIETDLVRNLSTLIESHPTWVRGLKQSFFNGNKAEVSRTLRGCVD